MCTMTNSQKQDLPGLPCPFGRCRAYCARRRSTRHSETPDEKQPDSDEEFVVLVNLSVQLEPDVPSRREHR